MPVYTGVGQKTLSILFTQTEWNGCRVFVATARTLLLHMTTTNVVLFLVKLDKRILMIAAGVTACRGAAETRAQARGRRRIWRRHRWLLLWKTQEWHGFLLNEYIKCFFFVFLADWLNDDTNTEYWLSITHIIPLIPRKCQIKKKIKSSICNLLLSIISR